MSAKSVVLLTEVRFLHLFRCNCDSIMKESPLNCILKHVSVQPVDQLFESQRGLRFQFVEEMLFAKEFENCFCRVVVEFERNWKENGSKSKPRSKFFIEDFLSRYKMKQHVLQNSNLKSAIKIVFITQIV